MNIKFSGSVSQRSKGHYQPAVAVHHSPIRTTKYGQKSKRPRQSPAKSHDNDDDVVLLPSTSAVVKKPKLHTTTTTAAASLSKKEQAQQERAERKKKEALVKFSRLYNYGIDRESVGVVYSMPLPHLDTYYARQT